MVGQQMASDRARRRAYFLTETWTSSPTMRTVYFSVATATGNDVGTPVRMLNAPPCNGHSISSPSIVPPDSEASSCVQVSSRARGVALPGIRPGVPGLRVKADVSWSEYVVVGTTSRETSFEFHHLPVSTR